MTNGRLGHPDRTGRGIAQLVEHWIPNPGVEGSSPSAPANRDALEIRVRDYEITRYRFFWWYAFLAVKAHNEFGRKIWN